jgi:hypothetical protein
VETECCVAGGEEGAPSTFTATSESLALYLYDLILLTEGEAKGEVVLCFKRAPRHEGVLGEWTYSYTHSLTSALDGGEWSASSSDRFTPRERTPCTHWIGGWVGPRAVLDAVVKKDILSPPPEINPRTPIIQPVS